MFTNTPRAPSKVTLSKSGLEMGLIGSQTGHGRYLAQKP